MNFKNNTYLFMFFSFQKNYLIYGNKHLTFFQILFIYPGWPLHFLPSLVLIFLIPWTELKKKRNRLSNGSIHCKSFQMTQVIQDHNNSFHLLTKFYIKRKLMTLYTKLVYVWWLPWWLELTGSNICQCGFRGSSTNTGKSSQVP